MESSKGSRKCSKACRASPCRDALPDRLLLAPRALLCGALFAGVGLCVWRCCVASQWPGKLCQLHLKNLLKSSESKTRGIRMPYQARGRWMVSWMTGGDVWM
jgi:hypothetical protein